ncbi:enolase-phosphatase E1-like [Mytilus edulis]|uniref:enolase-phosphatase E1-like n=1 Tax=Mytilus edulis TaxID=6550 RepID=UPI0039F1311A
MAENEAQFETFIPAGGYVMISIATLIGLAIISALIYVIIQGRRAKSPISRCPESSTSGPKPSVLDFNKTMAFSRVSLKDDKIDTVNIENETEPKTKEETKTKKESGTADDNGLPGESETDKPSVPPRQTLKRSLSRQAIATPEQKETNRYSVMSNSSVITRQASCSSILVRTSPDDAKRPESTRPESTMVTVEEHPEGPSVEIVVHKGPTPPPSTENRATKHPEKTTPPTAKAPLKRTMSRNAIAPIPTNKPLNRQMSKSNITPAAPAYKPMNRQMSRTMSRSVLRIAEHAPVPKPVIQEEHAESKKEEIPATNTEATTQKQETPATSTETTDKQETQATSTETTTENQETQATSTDMTTEKQETQATSTEMTSEKQENEAISKLADNENKETPDGEQNTEKVENLVESGTKSDGEDYEKTGDGTKTDEKDAQEKVVKDNIIEDVAEILNA